MAFCALYDACVLYPAPLRDLLVELAKTGLFKACWTERIHDEWIRNLLKNRPDLSEEALRRTSSLMNEAVEDCLVQEYDHLIPTVALPDEDDRHVVAAAIHGRADVLVTSNLKDFPVKTLARFRMEPQHPDVFIRHVLELDKEALASVRAVHRRLKSPQMTVDEYLTALERQSLPETVAYLREWKSLLS